MIPRDLLPRRMRLRGKGESESLRSCLALKWGAFHRVILRQQREGLSLLVILGEAEPRGSKTDSIL